LKERAMTTKTRPTKPTAIAQTQDVVLPEHNYRGRLTCREVVELPGLRGFVRGYLLEKEAGGFFVGLEPAAAGPEQPALTIIQPHANHQVVTALCRRLADLAKRPTGDP
jgi:hypothetical protein